MAALAACSVDLPDQPMDCCFHTSEPILASALVNGQVLVHRLAPNEGIHSSAEEQNSPPSCSYSAQQLLCRESKKAASCRAITFSADGSDLLCGFETGSILQLDPETGKAKLRLTKAHQAGINRLTAIPGSPQLAAAGDDDGGLQIWDLRSQSPAFKYNKHRDFISCLTVTEKHQALLAVSGDGTLSVHDLRGGKALAHSETDADDELLSVVVVKHGKKVVCGSQSGVLALWSWGYWNDCSDRFPGHPESVDAIVKWDEDTVITGSSDGVLRVINILPNKLLGVIGEHAEDMPVERLALSADKQLLASMSHDSCVKLWDMSVLQEDTEDDDQQQQQQAELPGVHQPPALVYGTVLDPAAATMAVSNKRKSGTQAAATAEDDDDDDEEEDASNDDRAEDDSDEDDEQQQSSRRKRKKHDRTAMSKGRGKPSKSGNFFADLL